MCVYLGGGGVRAFGGDMLTVFLHQMTRRRVVVVVGNNPNSRNNVLPCFVNDICTMCLCELYLWHNLCIQGDAEGC